MKTIAYLTTDKRHRKYNDVIRKKLFAAGIEVTGVATRGGRKLMVKPEDFIAASKIVLSVSITNPKY